MLNRRDLIKSGLGVGAGLALGRWGKWGSAQAFYQSPGIPLFQTALRGVGKGGIPVAVPGASKASVTGVTHYDIGVIQFKDQIIPPSTGLGPTKLWGYAPKIGLGGYTKPTHLSGLIVGRGRAASEPSTAAQPIQISFLNELYVKNHILPVDMTIPGAELGQPINRVATHLHGGLVPWISDGGPFDWFDPYGLHGLSFLNNQVLNPGAPPGTGEYYYPLNQSARFMWYHDHAFGITRLNAYAGIASGMLIRDGFEAGLIGLGLPNFIEAGGNELPIIVQDKTFVGPNILSTDTTWPGPTDPGSLWYAHVYDRWEVGEGGLPLPDPSVIPEFFGDTMLVNGTVFPQATVQARRYRLRFLNACNARFLNLQLYVDDGSPNGITLNTFGTPETNPEYGHPTNDPFVNAATGDPSFLQIGTEGGFLSKPVKVPSNQPLTFPPGVAPDSGQIDPSQILKSLLVAPAERPDVIVDFSGYVGKKIILYADAPAPFPPGDDRYDYFPGWNVEANPVNGTTQNGFGPNSRVLMRFNVVAASGPADLPLNINTETDLTPGIDQFLTPWGVTTPPPGPTRFLSLNEAFDAYGRLMQVLGDFDAPTGSPYAGTGETRQNVLAGDTEVWEIFNATADTHPMHFHLVNVQVINRQLFDVTNFPLSIGLMEDPIPPEPNELGWKETVQMYPGTVTRVIMKFDLPRIVDSKGKPVNTNEIRGFQLPIKNGQPPPSPRTGGNEYVWHCHILEHEEHDMMHALNVVG